MTDVQFLDFDGWRLEYVRLPATKPNLPPLVFLHEGLGSIAMWRDFPVTVAAATGAETLIYSRRGYGKSSPMPGPRSFDYMHDEAQDTLPKLLARLGIDNPVLIGHSDGASIAIIYAGSRLAPVAGLVLMAPHVFVEDITVESIAAANVAYDTTDLPKRLGRYHEDVDHTFRGWNDAWLKPDFFDWNIEGFVREITAPMLLIQGIDDEYGTPDQLASIRRLARAPYEVALLPDCRHSPHRDQPEHTLNLIVTFVNRLENAPGPIA
jgi:pimeloyl-ACP methyl ester carboxylesterase